MLESTLAFTMGVEEEYQIIDPQTRQLCARSPQILATAQFTWGSQIFQPEFRQSQIEIATPICYSLGEVRAQLVRLRTEAIAIAAQAGYQLAAAGTHPFSDWQAQPITEKAGYQKLVQTYQQLMQELVTFGCHIHIGIPHRAIALQVMNRARVWLAPLLALSASSPFWLGNDTGYASYRTCAIARLPMAGPPPLFASEREYQAMAMGFISTQTIHEKTQICWDLRPSERYPTLEFRLSDTCTTIERTVAIAGLARGLVRTCYEQALANQPYPPISTELLRAAQWRAARWGLEAELVDVESECLVPAGVLVARLLAFVRPALEAFGEWEEVCAIAQAILQQGTSATQQRAVYQQTGSLEAVVDFIVRETALSLEAVEPCRGDRSKQPI
ncbi:MAG: carboxylate-amine ligase [Desertifilum sp. SIO1I2]|nr:carboxylate-amine ligase [Desertifilum sp. SIO1I2]